MTNEKMKDLLVFLTNKTKERQLVWKSTDKKVFMIDDSYFIGNKGYFLEGFFDGIDIYHIHLDINCIADMEEEMEFDYKIDEPSSENSDVIEVFKEFEKAVCENAKQTEEECENAMIDLLTKNDWVKSIDVDEDVNE